jgi:hypothetical protein
VLTRTKCNIHIIAASCTSSKPLGTTLSRKLDAQDRANVTLQSPKLPSIIAAHADERLRALAAQQKQKLQDILHIQSQHTCVQLLHVPHGWCY